MFDMKWFLACLAAAIPCAARCAPAGRGAARARRIESIAIVERNVMIPMRDGVRLAADIVRPRAKGRYPVLLSRTPYGKHTPLFLDEVRAGVALAAQDVRGRYASEGVFDAFRQEMADGYDTVEWLAKQPWCDGRVLMHGGSYVGFTQLAAAMAQPPHLKAIMPAVPPADFDGRTMFYAGALRMELAQGWLLQQSWRSHRVLRREAPQAELARWRPFRRFQRWCWRNPLSNPGPIAVGGPEYVRAWTDVIGHWEQPGFWRVISAARRPEAVKTPVLILAGLYDIFEQEDIELLLALRARGGSEPARRHTHLLLGPWVHGLGRPAGEVNYPDARRMLSSARAAWLRRWIAGEPNEVDRWPPIRYFIIGAGRWADAETWPPAGTRKHRLYLTGRALAARAPEGKEPPTEFTYDPTHPAPTIAGGNLLLPKGARDCSRLLKRRDVVEFLSDPLDHSLVVAGRVRARLWVSTSAADTDFTAMLLDVRPDGRRLNVQDGIARLRYRRGRGRPELVQPGQVVALDIDLWSAAYEFAPGHRVALHVSSSNFPRFDRHFNSAEPPWEWTTPRKATQRVYHDALRPSFVEFDVLPDAPPPAAAK